MPETSCSIWWTHRPTLNRPVRLFSAKRRQDATGESTPMRTHSLSLMLSPIRTASRGSHLGDVLNNSNPSVVGNRAPRSNTGTSDASGDGVGGTVRGGDAERDKLFGPQWLGQHSFSRPVRCCWRVECVAFDWHRHVETAGVPVALQRLWDTLQSRVREYRWSHGFVTESRPELQRKDLPHPNTRQYQLVQQQKGYLHFTYEDHGPARAPGNHYVLLQIIGCMTQFLIKQHHVDAPTPHGKHTLLPPTEIQASQQVQPSGPPTTPSVGSSVIVLPVHAEPKVEDDVLGSANLNDLEVCACLHILLSWQRRYAMSRSLQWCTLAPHLA